MNKFFTLMLLATIFIGGCGGDEKKVAAPPPAPKFDLTGAKDGTYTIESSLDDKLGKSVLTLTISSEKITDAAFVGYDLLGNVKDETYGSLLSEGDHKKAQVVVKAINTYPRQLVETQDLRKVDAISGASISHGQFVETVTKAVDEAKK